MAENTLAKEVDKQSLAVAEKRRTVVQLLDKMKGQIANALPKFITADKMIRVAITAISRTPKLLECEQTSLIGAIITSSQLGLMPDGVLGEAYLIPFNNRKRKIMEVQFMIGYRGYVALALRSGQVKSIQARAVKQSDDFNYEFGLQPKLEHKPKGNGGEITHFYAVIHLMTGGSLFEVMTIDEVNFIRDKSVAYQYATDKKDTIWTKHYEEMGKKTVIRRLIKMAPLSPEINRAVGLDDLADIGNNQKNNLELLDMPEVANLQDAVYEEITNEENESANAEKLKTEEKAQGQTGKAIQETLDLLEKKK